MDNAGGNGNSICEGTVYTIIIKGGKTMNNRRRIALIPAYEPETLLIELLEKLKGCGFENVVVDDGSGSEYADIFEQAAKYAVVLTHPVNYGKGRALKTGLIYIQGHFGNDVVVVTVDADGQHRVEDAAMLTHVAEHHEDTLVLGSRKLQGKVPLRSRFGNAVTRFVYRMSTGLKVYDTQTGLRAFCGELIPRMLDIAGERYEYEMNVLLDFARSRIPIREEEIKTIYIGSNESSHFDTIKDSIRVYKEILKFSASSFASFCVDYLMYSLLTVITGSLRIANIGARGVSACVNYTLNRKLVFQSKENILKSAVSYFLLAAAILAGNTAVLELLAGSLGLNWMVAKVLTELLFFAANWLVQKLVIFRNKGADASHAFKETDAAHLFRSTPVEVKWSSGMADNGA